MSGSLKIQNIQISYVSTGAQPPIFVAGSFTDPPWQPQELDYVLEQPDSTDIQSGTSQYRFAKNVQVGEGRWQYKFRLGLGDWWVCDEHTEKVTDELGNENNLLTVKAPQLPSRGPEIVLEDSTLDEENHQDTQYQEGVKWKEVADQMPRSGAERNSPSRTMDCNVESNELKESDTRLEAQDKRWSPLSQGQFTLDDEISGSLDSKARHVYGRNIFRVKDQEEETFPLEEKLIGGVEDNDHRHQLVQGGAEQGSRRRRTSGKPFSTSSLEVSDGPKPSKGSFWERILEWLYSIFARLFSSGPP